ncbi:MAG: hypothetical protein LRY73_02155 [Bacillus sp. (in: Bacteria)]|nr:hypothetical protein [Bacillus sp. (in: firmicutes)]
MKLEYVVNEKLKDEKLRLLEDCIQTSRKDGEYDLIYHRFLFDDAVKETWEFITYSLICNEGTTENFRTRLQRLVDAFNNAKCHFEEGDENGRIAISQREEWISFYRDTLLWFLGINRVFQFAMEDINNLNPSQRKG